MEPSVNFLTTMALIVCSLSVSTVFAQSIPFRSCGEDVAAPTSVTVECESLARGVCVLHRGENHTVTVDFTPQDSFGEVESRVAWKSWVEMPLPDHDTDACEGGYLSCPLEEDVPATFTYPLHLQDFWLRRRYPVIWRLKDKDTEDTIVCFIFRIQIV